MLTTVRRGSTGADVQTLQTYLGLTADGVFGPRTETAVEKWQEDHGLYADGVVGPLTWTALEAAAGYAVAATSYPPECDPASVKRHQIVRLNLGKPFGAMGYAHLRLRDDVAVAFADVIRDMRSLYCVPSTSGGTRSLTARLSPTRSATSNHYTGTAVDLAVGAACNDNRHDLYYIERDLDRDPANRRYVVWAGVLPELYLDGDELQAARKNLPGELRKVTGILAGRTPRTYEAQVIDLTALLAARGFTGISARPSAWNQIDTHRSVYAGMEWWHFNYTAARQEGDTFGEELLKIHAVTDVTGTPPWQYRHYVWTGTGWRKP